jgi:hypothetical protein
MPAQDPTPAEALVAAENALSEARDAYTAGNLADRAGLQSGLRDAAANVSAAAARLDELKRGPQ